MTPYCKVLPEKYICEKHSFSTPIFNTFSTFSTHSFNNLLKVKKKNVYMFKAIFDQQVSILNQNF